MDEKDKIITSEEELTEEALAELSGNKGEEDEDSPKG